MNKITKKIIEMLLGEDDSISADKKSQILYQLEYEDYVPLPVSETKAAEILGMSYNTLYQWRNGKLKNKPQFPFKIMINKVSLTAMYDKNELNNYIKAEFGKGEQDGSR